VSELLELPPRLLHPVTSAAHVIGLSRSSLYKEIQAGHIGIVKVGSRTLVPHDELEAWVARHRTGELEVYVS